MQAAFQEQEQESDSQAAPSNHQQPAKASQGATPRQQAGVSQGGSHYQPAGATQATPAPQGSAQGSARRAVLESRGHAAKRGNGESSGSDGAHDLASRAADAQSAPSQEEEVPKALPQEQWAAVHPVNQDEASSQEEEVSKAVHPVQQDDASRQKRWADTSQQEAQQAGDVAGALNSRSIDGDDDGMLDRFGSVDIITGKPVRDLKLDPVRQLVKWRESIFGSRDSVSESLDKDDERSST